MKSMIVMMNAMKYYKHEELVREDSDVREVLEQEMSLPAYRNVTRQVLQKYFLK